MKAGITGLPYSGKTTLFCALTGQDYTKLSHGKDIHVGTVKVPDARLDKLYEIFTPKKKTNATMEYFDLAGQSSDKKKGMEPQALQTMKNANALIVVLDGFNADTDPRQDFDTILEDLALNDLIVVSNRIERLGKEMRSGSSPQQVHEKSLLEKCRDALENGESLKKMELGKDDEKLLRGFQFLTLKPILIVVNISEAELTAGRAEDIEKPFADIEDTVCAAICAEIEMEIIALEEEKDREEFLESMGIKEPAISRLIRLSYESLGLISFFTAFGPDEARAWTVRKGSNAAECAGVIHSDLERGFIRAETIAYDDFIEAGSSKVAREKGLFRIEGRDYIVKDGDILTIRFNV
ncbi:redox-regulated ATPase YchF [Candidatus Latescibacterota bacterium]